MDMRKRKKKKMKLGKTKSLRPKLLIDDTHQSELHIGTRDVAASICGMARDKRMSFVGMARTCRRRVSTVFVRMSSISLR